MTGRGAWASGSGRAAGAGSGGRDGDGRVGACRRGHGAESGDGTGPSIGSMVDDVTPGRYRHFKGGEYEVVLVARDVETEEPVVVYQALYGERGHWVRSLADFTAWVSRDGHEGPRFVRTGGVGGQP